MSGCGSSSGVAVEQGFLPGSFSRGCGWLSAVVGLGSGEFVGSGGGGEWLASHVHDPGNTAEHIALQVNCGFARVAILELSRVPKGHSRTSLDKAECSRKFRELFCNHASFKVPDTYFTPSS